MIRIYHHGQPRPEPITWGMGTVLGDADGSTGSATYTVNDLGKIENILANRRRTIRTVDTGGTIKLPPTLPGRDLFR